jgi:beta-galactosidase
VTFELAGPGAIIGLGNGDPNSHESEKGDRRSLFNGLAQIIVQTTAGATTPLTLRARAEGLEPATCTINVKPTPPRFFVPSVKPIFSLQRWRRSPFTTVAPDPHQRIAENDMNSWVATQPGSLQRFEGGNWAIFRTQFNPYAEVRQSGGRIIFQSITGKAEVWLDGSLVGKKETYAPGPLEAPLPAGDSEHTLNVRLESQTGEPAGFNGKIVVEKN